MTLWFDCAFFPATICYHLLQCTHSSVPQSSTFFSLSARLFFSKAHSCDDRRPEGSVPPAMGVTVIPIPGTTKLRPATPPAKWPPPPPPPPGRLQWSSIPMGCVSHQRGVAVDQHAKDNAAAEAITDLTAEEMAKLEPGAAALFPPPASRARISGEPEVDRTKVFGTGLEKRGRGRGRGVGPSGSTGPTPPDPREGVCLGTPSSPPAKADALGPAGDHRRGSEGGALRAKFP